MSQFDVYPNPASHSRIYPYLVQLQADVSAELGRERVVAPLVSVALLPDEGSVLMPAVTISGVRYRVCVPLLRSISQRHLTGPIANVRDARFLLLTAVDRLFTGA
jgi:hypothetical protein